MRDIYNVGTVGSGLRHAAGTPPPSPPSNIKMVRTRNCIASPIPLPNKKKKTISLPKPTIIKTLDKLQNKFYCDKDTLLQWRNALWQRYSQLKDSCRFTWEDRAGPKTPLRLAGVLSRLPSELTQTFCQVYYKDHKCITITLFFVKEKNGGGGTCLIQGLMCDVWTEKELETLSNLVTDMTDSSEAKDATTASCDSATDIGSGNAVLAVTAGVAVANSDGVAARTTDCTLHPPQNLACVMAPPITTTVAVVATGDGVAVATGDSNASAAGNCVTAPLTTTKDAVVATGDGDAIATGDNLTVPPTTTKNTVAATDDGNAADTNDSVTAPTTTTIDTVVATGDGDGDAVAIGDGDAAPQQERLAVTDDGSAVATGDCSAVATGDGDAVTTGDGDAMATGDGDAVATGEGSAVSTGDSDDTAASNDVAVAPTTINDSVAAPSDEDAAVDDAAVVGAFNGLSSDPSPQILALLADIKVQIKNELKAEFLADIKVQIKNDLKAEFHDYKNKLQDYNNKLSTLTQNYNDVLKENRDMKSQLGDIKKKKKLSENVTANVHVKL